MEDKSEEIQRACRLGDLELLKESLEKYPQGLDETDLKLGWTGLYRSVICGHVCTTEYLLFSGADPNIKTRMGDTALHQAAENHQLQIASTLLKHKADPNIQQNDGETPLHLACFKGDEEMALLLLQHKANPNLQNSIFGKTCLHYAVDYSYTNVISLLLQYNINTELRDKHGKTAKETARTTEVQILLNSFYIPSPEPSEIVQKSSIDNVSPFLSRSNSEISFTSDYKSVEHKVKQLDDMHKQIRDTVRASVDTVKTPLYSNNTSSIFEPDAERTGFDIILDRKKPVIVGINGKNPELYAWLCKKRLEECYGMLVNAGYDDLHQISQQMVSKMPITEQSLAEIGIKKTGHRKRLMLAFDELNHVEKSSGSSSMNPFRCCSVEVSQNLLMLNMPGLDKWLESLNLKELYTVFCDNGYEELEQMLHLMNSHWEITADDLIEIGINKPGYRHRILSKLKEDSWGLSKKTVNAKENAGQNSFSPSELCFIF